VHHVILLDVWFVVLADVHNVKQVIINHKFQQLVLHQVHQQHQQIQLQQVMLLHVLNVLIIVHNVHKLMYEYI
jgi:hypothetical protein